MYRKYMITTARTRVILTPHNQHKAQLPRKPPFRRNPYLRYNERGGELWSDHQTDIFKNSGNKVRNVKQINANNCHDDYNFDTILTQIS